jgi:hypothetical protein
LVSVLSLRLLTLIQSYNTIVLFSFVMGGVGACWLCYVFCKQYWASIIGGSVFTFSQYHFAHAEGHLQLVSVEWLPIFALFWYVLLKKPSWIVAICSAFALLLVILCDYYYFVYSVLYAGVMTGWEAWRRRDLLFLVREPHTRPFLLFAVLAAVTSGRLVLRLLILNSPADPLEGSHDAATYSTDLLAAIIPGGHWRFAALTMPFWETLPGNIVESSVALGLAVIASLVYVWRHRSDDLVRRAAPWWCVLLLFWLLSLGPVLRIWGAAFPGVPMPYTVLLNLVPAFSLSGAPVRMMVMVTLAAAVLTSVAFALMFRASCSTRAFACGLLVLLTVEYLPPGLSTTRPDVPGYVTALRGVSGAGGVLDLVSDSSVQPFGGTDIGSGIALYYQTIYERPMASGYVSRISRSLAIRLLELRRLVGQQAYGAMCREYDLRYLVLPADGSAASAPMSARLLFADQVAHADLFDLAPDGHCIDTVRSP